MSNDANNGEGKPRGHTRRAIPDWCRTEDGIIVKGWLPRKRACYIAILLFVKKLSAAQVGQLVNMSANAVEKVARRLIREVEGTLLEDFSVFSRLEAEFGQNAFASYANSVRVGLGQSMESVNEVRLRGRVEGSVYERGTALCFWMRTTSAPRRDGTERDDDRHLITSWNLPGVADLRDGDMVEVMGPIRYWERGPYRLAKIVALKLTRLEQLPPITPRAYSQVQS